MCFGNEEYSRKWECLVMGIEEKYEGELNDLRVEIERLNGLIEVYNKIFTHNLVPDKGYFYFVCGEGGKKDKNNLPERLHVCPAYGCDWFQVYERTDKTAGTEW